MKIRQVHTDFWFNSTQDGLSYNSRYLYMYLLTSPHINLCGVFRLPDQYMCLETGMDQKTLNGAKEELSDNKKVRFHSGWVYVVNAVKYNNNFFKSPKNQIAFKNELNLIPQVIKDKLSYNNDVGIDTYPNTNHNHTTNKQKKMKNKILAKKKELGMIK